MRTVHAVMAGLALGVVAWWWLGHPGYVSTEQRRERAAAEQAAAEPRLYRWRDAAGVLHITDKPPAGRRYEQVKPQEDVNVVPMSAPADPATPASPP